MTGLDSFELHKRASSQAPSCRASGWLFLIKASPMPLFRNAPGQFTCARASKMLLFRRVRPLSERSQSHVIVHGLRMGWCG